MATTELLLGFVDEAALRREYETNLRHGRAFVAGAGGIDRLAPCTLKLMRSDTFDMLTLDAQVVLVSDAEPMRGVAVQINQGDWREQLAAFVGVPLVLNDKPKATEQPPVHEPAEEPANDPLTDLTSPNPDAAEEATASSNEDEAPNEEESEADSNDPEKGSNSAYAERRQRIRHMTTADRGRVAHGSSLEDRVLLERIFGSSVWDMLLRSTTLTPPEVATIARKGSLSVPLIELVCDNQNWIRHDIVRRALLTNPRTPPHCIMKVLHAMPKNELRIMAEGAATYPAKVRAILQTLSGKRS